MRVNLKDREQTDGDRPTAWQTDRQTWMVGGMMGPQI